MAHRVRGRGFVRPLKKTMIWIGLGGGVQNVTAAKDLMFVLNAAALLLRPFTILRSHLEIWIQSDQTVATEQFVGVLGHIIVKEIASGIGVTAVPGPVAEIDSDWYIHQPIENTFLLGDATGFQGGAGRRYSVDSKAMRKVGTQEDAVTVLENTTSAVGANIAVRGRQLVQLH